MSGTGTGLLPLEAPVDITADEARRRALDELAKAKYGGTPDWLEDGARRLAAFLEWLTDLFAGVQPSGNGGGFSWGFLAVALVLLALIALVVWRVGLPRWRRGRAARAQVDLDPTRAATDYRDTAAAAAAVGDWPTAVLERYRAMVRELEVRTIIDARPGRTAYEVAFVAGRLLPGAHDDLVEAAASFGGVAYGDEVADAARYRAMTAIDERVTAAADRADLIDPSEVEPPVGAGSSGSAAGARRR